MLEELIRIIKEAGTIILQAQVTNEDVNSKSGRANFVTAYDVKVQRFLYEELSKRFPGIDFLGEEDETHKGLPGTDCFIIDPIDGTTNFIFDQKHSCISVGFMKNNEIIAGVVYDPYQNELFTAEKGKGAHLNGEPLKIKNISLEDGIVAFGTSPYYREKADETFALTRKLYDKSLDVRRSGSAALDLCYVAASRYALFFEYLLSPWDYAAASLILSEAGGRISTIEKHKLTLTTPCSVIAANPIAFEEFSQI
jgi:myo-inositol-1(or 4)-monophosphatase